MNIKLTSILLSLLILIGCENLLTKPNDTSDDELISDILDSKQIDINMEELPALSRNTIEQDYNDYIEIDATMAPDLGYQVSMDGKDFKPGDHNEVYFNLKGRKLNPKKGRYNRGDFKCFELILPMAFIMPDSTTIMVESEKSYMDIKTWYTNNPNTKEKPNIQYPVNIIYKDGIIKTMNNEEEMRSIKGDCRKRDDNKYWNCFKIEYPITFFTGDGTTISMEDTEDWSELKNWHETNPNSKKPALQYPVVISYRDGTAETINDDDEMRSAKENCRD